MDRFDALVCLQYHLNLASAATHDPVQIEDYKTKVELCFESLNGTIHNSELTDTEKSFVDETIHHAAKFLKINLKHMYHYRSTGSIPPSLYLRNLVGGIPFEQVNQVPSFQVRGRSFYSDKQKVTSDESLFVLRGIQVVTVPEFQYHVAQQPWCGYPKHAHDNEWLIVNHLIPGFSCVQVIALYSATPKTNSAIKSFVNDYANDNEAALHKLDHTQRAWIRCLQQFWTADETFCNERFKLIPNIVEGSWTVKMAVGNKPALTGKKLTQQYFRGKGYMEVDVDISSSSIAVGILALVRGVSKYMVVDLGITIQGQEEEELPEVVLCQTRYDRVDLDSATSVNL